MNWRSSFLSLGSISRGFSMGMMAAPAVLGAKPGADRILVGMIGELTNDRYRSVKEGPTRDMNSGNHNRRIVRLEMIQLNILA